MSDQDRDLVYSEGIKAGKRIYYFDVKRSRNGEKFVSITESKKIVDGNNESPHFSFEKHKIFLYKEDFEKFATALQKAIEAAKPENLEPAAAENTTEPEQTESFAVETQVDEIKIDLEF